jgi:hypothetical protein
MKSLYEEVIAMGLTKWAPRGLDVSQLRAEKDELQGRLRIIDKLLTALEAEGMGGRKRRGKHNTRLNQIREVLRSEGRALHLNAIYERLREKDPSLAWSQPAAALRSFLRRQDEGPDEVVSVERGQYGLRRWLTQPAQEPEKKPMPARRVPTREES